MCDIVGCAQAQIVITLNCTHRLCDAHARACAEAANQTMFRETADEVLGRRMPPNRDELRGFGRCPHCSTALTHTDYSALEQRYIV